MAIPWYRGEYELPRAEAEYRRSMAPFRLGGQLGKGAGQLLGATRDRMKEEDDQNAEMARLKSVLGLGQEPQAPTDQRAAIAPEATSPDAAEQQSAPALDSAQAEEARSGLEIDPTSDQSRGASVSAQAEGGQPQSAAGVIQAIRGKPAGPLRRIADTAMVGLGLKRDDERAARLIETARMKGQADRQKLQQLRAASMVGIARDAEDTGAVLHMADPSGPYTPGSIKMRPDPEKQRNWTEGSLAYEAGTDPQAAAALDRMYAGRQAQAEALARIRHPGGGGAGGGGAKGPKNEVEMAYDLARREYRTENPTREQVETMYQRIVKGKQKGSFGQSVPLPDLPPADTEEEAAGLDFEDLFGLKQPVP